MNRRLLCRRLSWPEQGLPPLTLRPNSPLNSPRAEPHPRFGASPYGGQGASVRSASRERPPGSQRLREARGGERGPVSGGCLELLGRQSPLGEF